MYIYTYIYCIYLLYLFIYIINVFIYVYIFIYLCIYTYVYIYKYIYSGTHGKYSDIAKCSWAYLKSDAFQVAIQLLVVTIKEMYNIIIIEYITYTLLVFSYMFLL